MQIELNDAINQLIKIKLENAEFKTKQDILMTENINLKNNNAIMKEIIKERRIESYIDKKGNVYKIDRNGDFKKKTFNIYKVNTTYSNYYKDLFDFS